MITSRGYFTGFITPPVRRDQLEYPTVDVTFAYLLIIGKAVAEVHWRAGLRDALAVITVDSFADRALEDIVRDPGELSLRYVDANNEYRSLIKVNNATADYLIEKISAGSASTLGSEAVDLDTNNWYLTRFSVSGSTLKAYRDDLTTPKITVTDTSFTSGKARIMPAYKGSACGSYGARLLAPSSPSPKPIAYFEVPIIGSGTSEDPFRANLPEDIRDGVNVLALTHSVLVKTGSDGKPIEYRGILRVFDQPDRPANLLPIDQALDALRAMPGVRELTREQAIAMAKRLDDKLHDLDLLSARELGLDRRKAGRDYKSWRVHNLGVREELLDISTQERYAEEDKGW